MRTSVLDLIGFLQTAVAESGIDLGEPSCEGAPMSTENDIDVLPQPAQSGRGAVVACRTRNAEVAGSSPAAQTTTRTRYY